MTDPFDVPERELPEQVRQAARQRVLDGIQQRPRRRRPGLAPLLIAAAVVTVMAGAAVATSTVSSNHPLRQTPARPTTTTTSGAPDLPYNALLNWGEGVEMQRCDDALPLSNTPWNPLLRVTWNGLTALLYRVDNDIVFCELTKERVTASRLPYPAPPAGNAPGRILFRTLDGTTAGVAAPGTRNLNVEQTEHQLPSDPAAVGNGVFIAPNGSRPTDHVMLVADGYYNYPVPAADLPQPLPPTKTGADPTADRTSPAGVRLGACLAAANPPVPDADYYAPGAYLSVDGQHEMQLGRLDNRVLACQQNAGELTTDVIPLGGSGHSVELSAKVSAGDHPPSGEYFVGIANDARASTVALNLPGQPDVTATADNRTFVLYLTEQLPPGAALRLTARDAAGTVIEQYRAQ
jgi:hypothetical protein